MKTLELLTLRRSHTLESQDVSQIVKSYAYLTAKGKVVAPSTSFIQAFELLIVSKWQDYTLSELCQATAALIHI